MLTGKIKGFAKFFIVEVQVEISDILVIIAISNRKTSKILRFKDIMEKAVQSVNFICSQAPNHMQFKENWNLKFKNSNTQKLFQNSKMQISKTYADKWTR